MRAARLAGLVLVVGSLLPTQPGHALPPETLQSVVSVLPAWPGMAVRVGELPDRAAPEGSGIAIAEGGLIATAFHVVGPAEHIDVRLADGRLLPAERVGHDQASDIALIRVAADLPVFNLAPRPDLADPVCLIGNAYGLGPSVTCGVVSALDVSIAGFNAVEDFVQTDAASNPGSSGGALVDGEGRLVGMMSAIFASEGDANIGVNFAVSTPLLSRIVDDLADDGAVDYVRPGWRLAELERGEQAAIAGARVDQLDANGPAGRVGIARGDVITGIGERQVRGPRDALAALALVAPSESVTVRFARNGQEQEVVMSFGEPR